MQMINGTARWKRARKTLFSLRNHRRDEANGAERKNQWKVLFRSKGDSRAREQKEDAIFPVSLVDDLWARVIEENLLTTLLWGRREKFSENLVLSVDENFSQQVHYDDITIIIIAEHRIFIHNSARMCICCLEGRPLLIFIHKNFLAVSRDGKKNHFCEGNECARQVRVGSELCSSLSPSRINHFCMQSPTMGLCDSYQGPEKRFGGALGWPRFRRCHSERRFN